jgi:hypothetical protein
MAQYQQELRRTDKRLETKCRQANAGSRHPGLYISSRADTEYGENNGYGYGYGYGYGGSKDKPKDTQSRHPRHHGGELIRSIAATTTLPLPLPLPLLPLTTLPSPLPSVCQPLRQRALSPRTP